MSDIYIPQTRGQKMQTAFERRQQEAAAKTAAHAEMIRRNKEANDAWFGPTDEERGDLQRQCDDYDPAARRRAVQEAGRRMEEALAETPALAAMVDLIAAMSNEVRAATDYQQAAELAGVPKADRKRIPSQMRDHDGGSWSTVDPLPSHFLPKIIVKAALARAEERRS